MPVGVIAAGISQCKASKPRQEEQVAHSVMGVLCGSISYDKFKVQSRVGWLGGYKAGGVVYKLVVLLVSKNQQGWHNLRQ
jgi:hypothetical protein